MVFRHHLAVFRECDVAVLGLEHLGRAAPVGEINEFSISYVWKE